MLTPHFRNLRESALCAEVCAAGLFPLAGTGELLCQFPRQWFLNTLLAMGVASASGEVSASE
jgi:hypothetical protein